MKRPVHVPLIPVTAATNLKPPIVTPPPPGSRLAGVLAVLTKKSQP